MKRRVSTTALAGCRRAAQWTRALALMALAAANLAALGGSRGYRWLEIGGELAKAAPQEGLQLLTPALADPAQSVLHALAIGLLEKMALHG